MWLFNSSVGRKVVMSVTGIALILFLTFHCAMNIVALISGEAYNMICELLGANWYAVVATLGLAALAVVHIVYAFILTAQNRRARGTERYAVTDKPSKVEWASQNMLVLGLIVVLGLLLHLFNFWYNMMFAEIVGMEGLAHGPADGFAWIKETFSCWVYVVLYIIWLVALWFHLSHGFWSAMQTIGWSGKTWFCRWRMIGNIYVSLLALGFLAVILAFAFKCAPSLCCEGTADACKAKTECVKPHACDKAHPDCCEMTEGCKKTDDCCKKAEGCKCEDCKCDPCQCDAEKACKCDPCECEDCKCAEKTGCKCDPCQCKDCKC